MAEIGMADSSKSRDCSFCRRLRSNKASDTKRINTKDPTVAPAIIGVLLCDDEWETFASVSWTWDEVDCILLVVEIDEFCLGEFKSGGRSDKGSFVGAAVLGEDDA